MGLDYLLGPRNLPNSASTSSISSTTTLTTSTSTSIRTTDLQLSLFANWHGDGKQQSDEPTINDVPVEITGITTDYKAVLAADSDGKYWARNIPVGRQYRIIPKSDNFRYVAISNSQFTDINDYSYIVDSDEPSLHLGLMEGFLTLPFTKNTIQEYKPWYVDLDTRIGYLRDWMGGKHTHDQHFGTDFIMEIGNELVAVAPGTVVEAEDAWPNVTNDPNIGYWDDGRRITIDHGFVSTYGRSFLSIYCHLDKVLVNVGQELERGKLIAKSGNTGYKTTGPHLHFQVGGFGWSRVDPYRDLLGIADKLSYWTKDDHPQSPPSS